MSDISLVPIRTALISVSDKTHLFELATYLQSIHVEIISTGGTLKMLQENNIRAIDISDYTGYPEMLEGRVKTLHPKVHGGLLAKHDQKDHRDILALHAIKKIDLLIVNLYPFEEAVKKQLSYDEIIENIDIGGPSMLRSAAKNHAFVTPISDIAEYDALMNHMKEYNGSTSLAFRKKCAMNVFACTARYDHAIAAWAKTDKEQEKFPEHLYIKATRKETLRYGENPHQQAALYTISNKEEGIPGATQLQGKMLSYNNIQDANAALQIIIEWKEPAAVIVKHMNPCGVAVGGTIEEAFLKAHQSDPLSAFGGIIALNQKVTRAVAQHIAPLFVELVIAPAFDEEALLVLSDKKNMRVLEVDMEKTASEEKWHIQSLIGGLLLQEHDSYKIQKEALTIATQRPPTPQEYRDLLFAFSVCKHVKSNAIVTAHHQVTTGIGAGQMSRVDSVRIALWKAKERRKEEMRDQPLEGILASDAFFPFADSIALAHEAGITAIIQPGGSMRDQEVIDAANERNMAMVFSHVRHFRH